MSNRLIHFWPASTPSPIDGDAVQETACFPAAFYYGPVYRFTDGYRPADNSTLRWHRTVEEAVKAAQIDGRGHSLGKELKRPLNLYFVAIAVPAGQTLPDTVREALSDLRDDRPNELVEWAVYPNAENVRGPRLVDGESPEMVELFDSSRVSPANHDLQS